MCNTAADWFARSGAWLSTPCAKILENSHVELETLRDHVLIPQFVLASSYSPIYTKKIGSSEFFLLSQLQC